MNRYPPTIKYIAKDMHKMYEKAIGKRYGVVLFIRYAVSKI